MRWAKQIDARPAVKRGRIVNKLTGDESREAEGRLQEKTQEVKDAPSDTWEAVKDKAGRVVNEHEERKEREGSR